MNYTLQRTAAKPCAAKVKHPLQAYQRSQKSENIGFVMILPEQNKVYWNRIAAKLHSEFCTLNILFNMKQFVQWYQPNQRELLSQSLFVEQNAFQLDLTIAYNRYHLRYCFLPLAEFLRGEPVANHGEKVWVGFVRIIAKQPRATKLSELLSATVRSV